MLLRERAASSYARSFVLPAELDDARSNAKLEHGVLTLELAKRQATPRHARSPSTDRRRAQRAPAARAEAVEICSSGQRGVTSNA